MRNYIIIFILGIALFLAGVWYLGLDQNRPVPVDPGVPVKGGAVADAELGDYLYAAAKYLPVEIPQGGHTDPIVLPGVMNAFETEEVPGAVPGKVLFIGDQVDESAVLVAGSSAFLTEPYGYISIDAGRNIYKKFYRRHYENDIVVQGQQLALIEPSEAFGEVLKEIAKVAAAKSELSAALAGEQEGLKRFKTAEYLFKEKKAIGREEYGSAQLTYEKLLNERRSSESKVLIAEADKDKADIVLKKHEIRAVLPYKNYTIKSIQRGAGTFLKQQDPVVMTVQSLERMMAEAQIEEQYAARLNRRGEVTATIEPTVLDGPIHDFPGHNQDVTSVAVSRDMKIVSGSDDKTVCVWTRTARAPVRKLDHEDAVKVVVCSPVGAKENLCIAGCSNGQIYLWDLDKDDDKPLKLIEKEQTHGDSSITALAFSPDGTLFASGAADGSIKIWNTADGTEKYAFVPANGVEKCHDDAVTSLTFTPQCRLISAGRDKSLRVWHLKEKGASPDGRVLYDRKGNVNQLGVSADGQWMLFDQGNMLKMFSVEKRTFVHTLSLPPNATPFETLALFSPDGSLLLTAGAPEGRLQLWRTPDAKTRGFEVRQFATREKSPVTCAAFSPDAGKGGANSFAVSASGHRIYLWEIPTPAEVGEHRIENVRLTLKTQSLDPVQHTTRVGFEVANPVTPRYPHGRFEAGRPVTIVID